MLGTDKAILDALDVVTTEGDIIFRNATVPARLARGNTGQLLTATATTINWADAPASVPDGSADGDVLYWDQTTTQSWLSGTKATAGVAAATHWHTFTGGNVTGSTAVLNIVNDAVTYAKMQNVSATSRILGRIGGGAGSVEELTGANVLTITGAIEGVGCSKITVSVSEPGSPATGDIWFDIS
jgi:hypothetical protein